MFQRLAVVGRAAHGGVQAETLHVDAQRLLEARLLWHATLSALHREHLLAGARSHRDGSAGIALPYSNALYRTTE